LSFKASSFIHLTIYYFLLFVKIIVQVIYCHPLNDRKRYNFKDSKDWIDEVKNRVPKIKKKLRRFVRVSKAVQDTYWGWVDGNPFDERIYFSTWARFLKFAAETLDKLGKLRKDLYLHNKEILQDLDESANLVIGSSIKLYRLRAAERSRLITKLEAFSSDDLPDFVGGLSDYYKKMSKILLKTCEYKDGRFKEMACKSFGEIRIQGDADREVIHEDGLLQLLKKDHLELLDKLDTFEQEFGENQRISSLKRCNQRLTWVEEKEKPLRDRCEVCLPETKEAKKAFCGLLECVRGYPTLGRNERESDSNPNSDDYENIMIEAEEKLIKQLKSFSQPEPKKHALRFFGLQRWNSLTPAQGRSVGGGYFIYRTDKKGRVDLGIAIDPGFDFVRNLFRMGFSLRDIDIVIISHAHPDHLWDFESMVQLLHELEEKEQITHRLNVVLTLGAYHRLEHVINNPELRRFMDPLVIDSQKEINKKFFEELCLRDNDAYIERRFGFKFKPEEQGSGPSARMRWRPVLPGIDAMESDIDIWPARAYHDDYSERSDSFGFLIEFNKVPSPINKDKSLCFGYTGDTKWVGNDLYNEGCPGRNDLPCKEKCKGSGTRWEGVASQYKDCDVLLMHIGSLIEHKGGKRFADYSEPQECEAMIRKTNHPYLMGLIRFLRDLYPTTIPTPNPNRLILLGEFGEELRGGIRSDLVRRLRDGITGSPILAVDVGLDVLLHDWNPDHDPKTDNKKKENYTKEGFEFLCVLCEQYHHVDKARYRTFGQDEAIFHVCKTCDKAVPSDVRQTKLQHLYEIGRELKAAD